MVKKPFPRGLKILSNKLKKLRKSITFLYDVYPLASIPITLSLVLGYRTKDPILEPLYFLDQGLTIIDYKFKYDYSINTNNF